jgi:hypothetical protein
MKNLFLVLLFAIATSASAQGKQAADSNVTLKGLPVLRSYVAPDVVERAKKKYGRALYCMEKSTAANCQNSYLVGLLHNGRLTMEWMCDDPKMVLRIEKKVWMKTKMEG